MEIIEYRVKILGGLFMLSEDVVIKEPGGGMIICLNTNEPFSAMKEKLGERVDSIDDLMVGAQVVLDVGERKVTKRETRALQELLLERGLHLKRLISRGRKVDIAELPKAPANLSETETAAAESPVEVSKEPPAAMDEAILVKRTLRSGQKVYYPGNIVILGDVNPGAEVIAGGNILVMGCLRGMAHAGALGCETAVIAAYRLHPTQLRIANHFTRPPDNDRCGGNEPEVAQIREGIVVIEKYRV